MTESKPVELLRDRRAIYGIGFSDPYDIEALAWACGADPADTWQIRRASDLILRPDTGVTTARKRIPSRQDCGLAGAFAPARQSA